MATNETAGLAYAFKDMSSIDQDIIRAAFNVLNNFRESAHGYMLEGDLRATQDILNGIRYLITEPETQIIIKKKEPYHSLRWADDEQPDKS